MADGGPPVLQPYPIALATQPTPTVQLLAPPAQQIQPVLPPQNWSHFKPGSSGKPEDDAEVHLLRTSN